MFLINKLGPELQKIYIKILKKLNNIKGSRKSISKGFATGVAMSFTPFVGFHILLSLFVTKVTKQNGVASTLGTIFGNPWTFPFIWYLTLHTGYFLLAYKVTPQEQDFKIFFLKLYHSIINIDFNLFLTDIWPMFLPMLVGCIPYYIIVWWGVYYMAFKALSSPNNDGR
ncbi:MAG: DUF2062 domain-containing protein [Alphaproteobacteria bacterium]|nr:DUF2062 domain-containing protein [Alphaproteobacteria bacterium]